MGKKWKIFKKEVEFLFINLFSNFYWNFGTSEDDMMLMMMMSGMMGGGNKGADSGMMNMLLPMMMNGDR